MSNEYLQSQTLLMGNMATNQNEIEAWLKTQPREVITVFAVRATLRIIPKLTYLIEINKLHRPYEHIILSSFWATSMALSTGLWPNGDKLRSAAQTSTDFIVDDAVSILNIIAATSSTNSATVEEANIALNSVAHSARTANFNVRRDADIASATTEATSTAIVAALNPSTYLEYALDRDMIESGLNAYQLAARKLWNAEDYSKKLQPNTLAADWGKLKSYLLSQKSDWEVWIDWFEARLKGFPLIEDIDIGLDPENGQYGRCTLPEDYYKDPAKANAAIKEIIDAYWERQEEQNSQENSDVPAQNPASLKPVIRNGKIYLSDKPIDADLELHLAIANMLALRDEFEEFFTSIENEGNFDKRPVDFLKTISALIPNDIPDSRTLFRLIRKEAAMEKYEATVIQEWPQFFADRYSSLLTELGQILNQFPDRRAFQRQKLSAEIEDVDFEEFKQDFEPVLEAIQKENEIIDRTVPKAIADIGELSDGPPELEEQLVIIADQLDSTNNVLKALTNATLDPIARRQAMQNIGNAYAGGIVKGTLEGAHEAGVEDGKKLGAAAARAQAGKTAGKAIYEKYPERFSWLKRILRRYS